MWNRGGEGVALLMMIMHSLSTTFSNYFSGILFTLLRQVTFAKGAKAELKTEGEIAALGMDVDHLAGMLLFIVHSLAAAGDTVFQLDIRGDHCVVCVLSVGGNRIVRPVSRGGGRPFSPSGKDGHARSPLRTNCCLRTRLTPSSQMWQVSMTKSP